MIFFVQWARRFLIVGRLLMRGRQSAVDSGNLGITLMGAVGDAFCPS